MSTVEELTVWRDALFRALLSGVREVRDQNGESVRYASTEEMAAALRAADNALRGQRATVLYPTTSKGLAR